MPYLLGVLTVLIVVFAVLVAWSWQYYAHEDKEEEMISRRMRDSLVDVPYGFKTCDNTLCSRLTSLGSKFCCGPCAAAAEENPYEIDGHSPSCTARMEERRLLFNYDPESERR